MTDNLAPASWLDFRIGRSTWLVMTAEQIEMRRVQWTNDLNRTHGMDARTRAHLTRVSNTPRINPGKCMSDFALLPAAERVAIYEAAAKCIRPLPDSMRPSPAESRDQQFYRVSICSCSVDYLTEERLEAVKKAAMEEMHEAEIIAAMEKTQGLATRFKSRAARSAAH